MSGQPCMNLVNNLKFIKMKTLMNRFKVVALLIMSDDKYEILQYKLETVADAIDTGAPVAEDMVCFLEESAIKIGEYFIELSLN